MTITSFDVIRNLMKKDGTLEQEIYDRECELRRDLTIEEEDQIIIDMLNECKERMQDLSCSLVEAYKDIMQ